MALLLFLGFLTPEAWGDDSPPAPADFVAYARKNFEEAQARFRQNPANPQAAWQFGRACFDLAECATNRAERAEIAEQGIAACREVAARASNSAPVHYYWGMNLGQLARTRGMGALKIVGQMRHEFELARSLDDHLDYGGADRNLGLLYRDAPAVISVGNRGQAQRHLERAVTLAPDYPDNRLNLIEAYLKWGENNKARQELSALEAVWPAARAKFTGPAWSSNWADWEQQLQKFKKKLGESRGPLETPRGKR